jgi:predicted alpha/beta hydrolase
MTPVQLSAVDGVPLAGTFFASAGAPKATVVIPSAMGVPRRIYSALGEYLAESGLSALSFDYRGTGDSATKPGVRPTLEDWGQYDLAGALQWAAEQSPKRPVFALCHSVGGQLLGLAPNSELVAGAVFVASQSGYWGHWPGFLRLGMFAFWHLVAPAAALSFGYLKMGRGEGSRIPRDVALQWARWGRHPQYILSGDVAKRDRGHDRFNRPILSYAISDDRVFAPRAAVEELLRMYPAATKELRDIAPREAGVKRIGHFGWLRPALKDALWAPIAKWLLQRC